MRHCMTVINSVLLFVNPVMWLPCSSLAPADKVWPPQSSFPAQQVSVLVIIIMIGTQGEVRWCGILLCNLDDLTVTQFGIKLATVLHCFLSPTPRICWVRALSSRYCAVYIFAHCFVSQEITKVLLSLAHRNLLVSWSTGPSKNSEPFTHTHTQEQLFGL